MLKSILLLLCFLVFKAQAQTVIPLYDGAIPFAKPGGFTPTLTVFKPAKPDGSGTAVIVCSGGAYVGRANSVEGLPACKMLNAAGITAFLLDYRVPDPNFMQHQELVPLTDAQRALQYVREHANEYGLRTDRIGMMGFSAGGHLVSTVGTHFKHTELPNTNNISLRPDFMVLVYPVISMADSLTHQVSRSKLLGDNPSPELKQLFSNELQVTDDTPPTFITHANDDSGVKIQNTLFFTAALEQHHVPVKLFVYVHGGHGFGVNNPTTKVQWIDDCLQWIKTQDLQK